MKENDLLVGGITLDTDRCRLVKLREGDYDQVRKLYVNDKVRAYLGGPISHEKAVRDSFAELFNRTNKDSLNWVISAKNNGQFIGLVSLDRHHDVIETEVSYQLLPEWWGKGYASEVVTRILTYAFLELGLTKITAVTQTANKSSCRLLERVGMTFEHTIYKFNAEQSVYSITMSQG